MGRLNRWACVCAAALMVTPAAVSGETIYTGDTIQGVRVISQLDVNDPDYSDGGCHYEGDY